MTAARNASYEKYPEVWRDSSKMKQIVSFFLFNATHHVLEGRIASDARWLASFACYFQQYVTVNIDKQKAMLGQEIRRGQVCHKNGDMPQ
eukprot:scaffold21168_cov141-Skeletonema_dohrnii-CCMP3373.AAC.8